MSYGDFKDLGGGAASNKLLRDEVFNIAKNPKYDEYQRGFASVFYNFLIKRLQVVVLKSVMNNYLLEPIIRNLNKRKVYSSFKDNIWGADLADMQLISKFNKRIRFLLSIIDVFNKYAKVVPLKDKKVVTIVNGYQSTLNDLKRKPNKIWLDKGSEFYNKSVNPWLEKNDMEMHSTNNEGKSIIAKRFIRTLKTEIYKYMTSASKNLYINKLDDIVSKYNNTYHRTIKMKDIDVRDIRYIDSGK